MTAPAVERERELPGQFGCQPLADLTLNQVVDLLGEDRTVQVGSVIVCSLNNGELRIPDVGAEGKPTIQLRGPNGKIECFLVSDAVIGKWGEDVLIVSPPNVSTEGEVTRTNLSWFEVRKGLVLGKSVVTYGDEASDNPKVATILWMAEEANKEASRRFQEFFS